MSGKNVANKQKKTPHSSGGKTKARRNKRTHTSAFGRSLRELEARRRSGSKKSKHLDESSRRPVSQDAVSADTEPQNLYKVRDVAIAKIKVVGERRPVDPEGVKTLAKSFRAIGIRTPLTVRKVDGEIRLVAGLHRLEAAKSLGWKKIPCTFLHGGKVVEEMWQIGENLHRTPFLPLEESAAIARWVELWKSQNPGSTAKKSKRAGRPRGGTSEAARALPVKGGSDEAKRKNVEQALKIDGMEPEVKQAVRDAGLNQKGAKSKLSKIASQKTIKDKLDMIHKVANSPKKDHADLDGDEKASPFKVLKREWPKAKKLKNAYERAPKADRRRFITKILKYPLGEN